MTHWVLEDLCDPLFRVLSFLRPDDEVDMTNSRNPSENFLSQHLADEACGSTDQYCFTFEAFICNMNTVGALKKKY